VGRPDHVLVEADRDLDVGVGEDRAPQACLIGGIAASAEIDDAGHLARVGDDRPAGLSDDGGPPAHAPAAVVGHHSLIAATIFSGASSWM
jgi:hypothetical protein